MRLSTVVAVVLVVGLFGALTLVAFGGLAADSGSLTEVWTSDTPRDNQVNHHAIGVGPDRRTIVAPVSEIPGDSLPETACSLVRLDPATGAVQWRASIPPENCFTHGLTQPEIADIDGDGELEVVSGTTADDATLIAYDGTTGDELFRVPLRSYAGYGRPTAANVTAEPGLETVAVDIGGNVVVVDANGTVLWRRALDATTYASPVVADLDGDGTAEIAVGTRDGTVVLTPAGDVKRRSSVPVTTVTHADVDDDPAAELVVASARTVVAIDGNEMTTQWEASFEETPRVHAVGDGDDGKEVYVGLADQRVVALSATTGERQWETRVGPDEGSMMPAPILGDVTGDGDPEVVAVTNGGTVAVLDAETGSELAAYERDVPVWTVPSVAHLDDDGDLEVLVRYGDGRVVALDYEE